MRIVLFALAVTCLLTGCATGEPSARHHAGMDHSMMLDNSMKWDGSRAKGAMATCAMCGPQAQAGASSAMGGMCGMAPQQGQSMGGTAMSPQGAKEGMQGCPMMAKSGQQGMGCCCGAMMKHGT